MGKPVASALSLKHVGTPATPPAGELALYAKSDNSLYVKTPAGTETAVGGGGGSIPARLGPTAELITDWNSATSTGFYMATNTAANAPTANFYHGKVTATDANNLEQIITVSNNVSETANAHTWRRVRVTGTWGSWLKVGVIASDIRTMAHEVPSYASNRVNQFDPYTSIYNASETSTQTLRTKLVQSLTDRILLGVWGHSISAGSLTSAVGQYDIASQIRRFLTAEQSNVNGTGFVYIDNRIGGTPALNRDVRWTSITGWTQAGAVNSMWASSVSATANAVFTSDAPGVVVEVATFDITGLIHIYIDGILMESFTGGGTNAVVIRSFSGLENTRHTVEIKKTTTATSYLIGVRVRGGVGLEVSNQGQGGSSIQQWQSTGTYAQNYNVAQSVAPADIVFLALGDGNEIFQAIGVEPTRAYLQATITALQATGAAVVMMTAPAMSPAGGSYATVTEATWNSYLTMMYDVADQFDVPLVDTRHLFVSYAAANAQTWMGDTIHPNDTGHSIIARAIATHLLKVIPYDSKPDALLEEWETPPSAPATGIKFYAELRGWRSAAMQPAGGHRTPLQPALWANRTQQITVVNNVATPQYVGIAAPTYVNGAGSTPTAVNSRSSVGGQFFANRVKIRVASNATSGASALMRTAPEWWISNAAQEGGFRLSWRLGFNQITATNRMFFGLSATNANLANANPSTLFNLVGFGADSADTNLQVIHNDASGAATKIDLGASFPATTAASWWYEMRLYCQPGISGTLRWCIIRLNDQVVRQGVITTNFPAVNTLLAHHLWHNNGTTLSAVHLDIGGCYYEMDN